MKSIGNIMNEAMNPGNEMEDPVVMLRNLIEEDRSKLIWIARNKPEIDLSAKREHLVKLDAICRKLEAQPPIEPWRIIWDKLGEAKREKINGDLALVYFPLKPQLPEYYQTKQVVIDLCGYNMDPREYSLTGFFGKQFYTSGIDS